MIISETNPQSFYYLPMIVTQIISTVFAIIIVFLVHCSLILPFNFYDGLNITMSLYQIDFLMCCPQIECLDSNHLKI